MSRNILLIGAGSRSDLLPTENDGIEWDQTWVTTLDINPAHQPDVIHDLNILPWPFKDEQFLEVHAYEVLEHLGRQGDVESFFATFSECWRVLKPDGLLVASVPRWDSVWAWGDPSHTRVINEGTLVFLSQKAYEAQVGVTPMSDFRHIWHGDFEAVIVEADSDILRFALRAIK